MPWFFTVVLIGISAATLAFTGYLLRCVLTAELIAVAVPAAPAARDAAQPAPDPTEPPR